MRRPLSPYGVMIQFGQHPSVAAPVPLLCIILRSPYHLLCPAAHNRWFEATLHAGKVKAYIQFVLALATKALNGKAASSRKREFNPESARYDFRVFLLHLGLIGDEYKTARKHLLAAMPGDAAFKHGRPEAQTAQSVAA